jgi:NADPH:quinone reductase-like Zn-dependent oxidoreductase
MKAAVLVRTGEPHEAFELRDAPDPEPGPGQVRVDLVAAALNRRDRWQRIGDTKAPAILGSDGAGIVSAVGEGVIGLSDGDEVVINPSLDWGEAEAASGPHFRILGGQDQGTYAERIVVAAHQVRLRPRRLSWEESAALPLAGLTAWRAAVTHGEVGPRTTVLVPGVGGGVATFLVQIASSFGARVVVTSSSVEKIERACELGASAGADYRDPDWPAQVGPVDVAVDSVGAVAWPGIFESLKPGGRLVSFGRTSGEDGRVDIARLFFGYWRIQGTTMGSPREFDALLGHVTGAQWRPVVDSVFTLAEVASAHERLDAPGRFGKVVLAIKG